MILEDTNKALTNHIPWHLPPGVRSHLENVKKNNDKTKLTKNHTTKEAWDHLIDILEMDNNNGIKTNEMKRIKHWFDTHYNSTNTKQYELYGGDVMKNWVNNQLNSARTLIKQQKEIEKAMGKQNTYKKSHDVDRQTTITKLIKSAPNYNPTSGNKLNRLKELSALNENINKIIVLNEEQIKNIIKLLK